MKQWLILSVAFGLVACEAEEPEESTSVETLEQVSSVDGGASTPAAADGGLGRATLGSIGAACVADADCTAAGTKCVTDVPVPFGTPISMPGGYCSKPCAADAECGAGAACPLAGAAAFLPGISQCLNACKVASDCRDGYRCGASSLPSFGGAAPAASASATHCLPPSPGVPAGGIPGLPGSSPAN